MQSFRHISTLPAYRVIERPPTLHPLQHPMCDDSSAWIEDRWGSPASFKNNLQIERLSPRAGTVELYVQHSTVCAQLTALD